MILDTINNNASWLTIFLILFSCHVFGFQLVFFLLMFFTAYVSFSRYHILGFVTLLSLSLFGTLGATLIKMFILLTLFVYDFDKIKTVYKLTKSMLSTAVNVNSITKLDDDTSKFIIKLNDKFMCIDRIDELRLKIVDNINNKMGKLKSALMSLSFSRDISNAYGCIEKYVSIYTNFTLLLIYENLVLIFDFYPLFYVKRWIIGYYSAYSHITLTERESVFKDEHLKESMMKLNDTANMFETLMSDFNGVSNFDTLMFDNFLSSGLSDTIGSSIAVKKTTKRDKNYKTAIENMIKDIAEKKVTVKKKGDKHGKHK
jgi:hypothetical protein